MSWASKCGIGPALSFYDVELLIIMTMYPFYAIGSIGSIGFNWIYDRIPAVYIQSIDNVCLAFVDQVMILNQCSFLRRIQTIVLCAFSGAPILVGVVIAIEIVDNLIINICCPLRIFIICSSTMIPLLLPLKYITENLERYDLNDDSDLSAIFRFMLILVMYIAMHYFAILFIYNKLICYIRNL
ncbi:hypothetical protein GJ496_002561 [Pomphorhynchus laevis]|nr:hypothetical protein GJ496_002561 [Pomphorhynchus laevis]